MQFLGFGLPDFGEITGLPVIDPNPVPVAPPPQVQPAPVKPPRAEPVKVPIKQPPVRVPQPVPLPPVLTEPPMPMPGGGGSGPIIANPGVPPIPVPPMEPQIPIPAPAPQVPAPVPQPAPLPIPEPPMPAPMPQVPAPMPMPAPTPEPVFSIPTPVPQPAPEPILPPAPPPPPPVAAPLPPAPPVNELPPPVQVPPPINLPAPPDDIVSRGTVGPVAPPPVEVPPPVMMPEPVAPPIPLAPSQPGVPTPMAPGSFQGVLPAPEPVAPPPVEVPPPVMQPAPEAAPALTPDQLVNEYNSSPGAQDFDLTATYDPQTNTFVEDVSAFGFEGDQATNTYTPEEFADRLGYDTETVSFTPSPEALVNQYNTSPAAQDFGVSVRYDPDTNTYIEDVSSFGFQGDQATNTYTQEEFLDRLGYGDPQPAPTPEPAPAPVELPPMMEVDPEPGVLPTFGRVDDPRLAQVQPPMDEPTGIETMAPAVGFGDYLGGEVQEAMPTSPAPQPAQGNTISLPDGSSFDLGSLDLTGLPGEGFDFEMPTMPGPTPPGPTPEPTPEPAPSLPTGRGMTLNDLVSLGQDAGGFVEPETGVYTPGQQPAGLPQSAINEAQGTSPSDFMGSFNPEDYVTPAGQFLTDGQLAEYGDLEPGTPIPTNTTNTSLTPEQQSALDQYRADNPGGINVDLLGFNPFGQMSGMGSFGSIPSGTVPDGQGGYNVIPVGPVGDLDNTGGPAPAPGPIDVRSASSYGLTGAQQTMPVSDNPFRRPETQGGIGSLAGGG